MSRLEFSARNPELALPCADYNLSVERLMRTRILASLLIAAGMCVAQNAPPSKNAGPQNAPEDSAFSDAVVDKVLNEIRNGLEAHSASVMLSAFDRDRMNGYGTFADQVRAFFDRYEAFRVRYRIAETTVEGGRGVALVEFEMEETPRAGNAPPERKTAQLRFELERGGKGWKIVDLQPRGFFS